VVGGVGTAAPKGSDWEEWFDELKRRLESSYLRRTTPWARSDFSGSHERWERLRRPIVECVDRSGAFLDIGCANGYLLECLIAWAREKSVELIPYGVDLSERLIALARARLSEYAENLFCANAFDWVPPRRFDYVQTELCRVPAAVRTQYPERLLEGFVTTGGRLLIAEYRSTIDDHALPWVDEGLNRSGFPIGGHVSGFGQRGLELTRVAWIGRQRRPRGNIASPCRT
jgi:SAM-dependent methyltransferase